MHQVFVALLSFGQQDEMEVVRLRGFFVHPVAGHIDLATDDRFNPGRAGFFVKRHRAVEIAVIRNRQIVLPQIFRRLYSLGHLAGAVQQAVLRVKMQMAKGRFFHGVRPPILPNPSAGKRPNFSKVWKNPPQFFQPLEAEGLRRLTFFQGLEKSA